MDTFGWDVVCACSSSKLNELLAMQFAANPATLTYTDNASTQLNLVFDSWRIISGGSVKKLRFELPVKTGTLASPLNTVKLDGVVIVAELELQFVSGVNATTSNLQFSLQAVATQANDPNAGSIFIVNADRDGLLKKQDPSGVAAMALHDIVPQCLIANKAKLAYVLSSLNLTPSGSGSWLAPQSPHYAFVQGGNGSSGYLAVFSMLSNADTSALQLNVDPNLCDGLSDVCVVFAPYVFLEHVIMPTLPAMFSNAIIPPVFQMQSGHIVSIGLLACAPVSHMGTNYYPILYSFMMTVSGDDLSSSASGMFDITGLAKSSVTFSESANMSVSFDAASQQILINQDGTPTSDHATHIPWYLYIAAAPFLLILGPLVAGIVVAIVDGVIAGVTASVANKVSNSGSNLALANWSANSFQFPGFSKLKVDNAALSDSFYMRCTLST